ncbi:MAG: hypothetical protein JSR28_07205, partial [Proteobacteria bacterium]|nr:hypothetical protein [Pseudomonadota bacterium]
VSMFALMANPLSGLLVVLATIVALLLMMWRDRHHLNVLDKIGERLVFWNQKSKGLTAYRAGLISKIPHGHAQLPGMLAQSQLFEFRDSFGDPFAAIYYRTTAQYTVVFMSQPQGESDVDQEQRNQWVANWGQWIAERSNELGAEQITATVETAAESGIRARAEVERRLDPNAAPFSRAVMRESVAGAKTPRITSYVTVTFAAVPRPGAAARPMDEMAVFLSTRVRSLAAQLSQTGAGPVRPCTPADLTELARVAYEPATAEFFDQARAENEPYQLQWNEAGPTAHQADWDKFFHDGAVSRTWTMTQPPRAAVQETSLRVLLNPHQELTRKRVTMIYRPMEAQEGSRTVDKQVNEASAERGMQKRANARMNASHSAMQRTADEEANGAAMVPFGMIVTATTTDLDNWSALDYAIESLSAQARILLRPAYGTQAAGFAAGLPLGIVPAQHSQLTGVIRRL